MVKDILKKDIIEVFQEKKGWRIQTIRDKVSGFKIKECQKCTQNGAAYILGLIEGIKVWNKLEKEDKEKLPQNISGIVDKYNKKLEKRKKAVLSKIKKPIKKYPKIKIVSPLNYSREAVQMMEAYRWIFCLENTLRDFIRKVFKNEKNWMDKRIDSDIKESIKRAKKEPYYAYKRKDDLEYVTLGQLQKIIISKKNWGDFIKYLNEQDKKAFITTFKKILPSRNSTSHCISLPPNDIKWIEFRVREVALMFKF